MFLRRPPTLLVETFMILSDRDIREFMKLGKIRFEPAISDDQIGPGSVDLTLSDRFWKLRDDIRVMDLFAMGFEDVSEQVVASEIVVPPHGLVIGMTREKIYLDDDVCGWIEGRSRYARMGLSIHSASGFIHPGSHNHQVLEILNLTHYPMKLRAGIRVAQVVFELARSRTEKPYRLHGVIARSQ